MSRRPVWLGSSPVGNYGDDLARLARPGAVLEVEVKHDSWCALLGGRGPCNCSPEVAVAGPLEAAILAALEHGAAPAWRVAERLGVSVVRVAPLLADLRQRGAVECEPRGDGVRVWRLA